MIDDDLRTLVELNDGAALDGLEADVWAGVENHEAARRNGRVIVLCQAAVMVLALFGSAAVGTVTAQSGYQNRVMLGGSGLAPSTLLLGQHR